MTGAFKTFLIILLKCVIVLAVCWGITLILGVIPLPFVDVVIKIVWIVGFIVCLWMLGVFLISLIPDSGPNP